MSGEEHGTGYLMKEAQETQSWIPPLHSYPGLQICGGDIAMANQHCGVGVWSWGKGRAAAGRFVQLNSSPAQRGCMHSRALYRKGREGDRHTARRGAFQPRAQSSGLSLPLPQSSFLQPRPCVFISATLRTSRPYGTQRYRPQAALPPGLKNLGSPGQLPALRLVPENT